MHLQVLYSVISTIYNGCVLRVNAFLTQVEMTDDRGTKRFLHIAPVVILYDSMLYSASNLFPTFQFNMVAGPADESSTECSCVWVITI